MNLHREALEAGEQWWKAYDRLIDERNARVTDQEREELVQNLENLILRYGETLNAKNFEPHALQNAARRLIAYYTKIHRMDDVRRLHVAIAKAFEHFASLGDALLASTILQTAVNSYRDAGLPDDSKRTRILMQEKIGDSRSQMKSIETKFEIPHEDIEKFLTATVLDDLGETFVRIAAGFLPKKKEVEEQVQKALIDAPISALMPLSIVSDNRVVATIGSIDDDLFGRTIHHAEMGVQLSAIWLDRALSKTIEKHSVLPEHFGSWANRHGLFEDLTFLMEGIDAWYKFDYVKAVHVLVPQIEHGLRSIVGQLGKPVTKPHQKFATVSVSISMGDILNSAEIVELLGPDITLHFLSIFADPRGMNLRNRVAHGMFGPQSASEPLIHVLIHTLLVFGIWKELAAGRR